MSNQTKTYKRALSMISAPTILEFDKPLVWAQWSRAVATEGLLGSEAKLDQLQRAKELGGEALRLHLTGTKEVAS